MDIQASASAIQELCRTIRDFGAEFQIHEQARLQYHDHLQRLLFYLSSPQDILDSFFCKVADLAALRYVHRYEIDKYVPENVPISFPDLAQSSATDCQQLEQMVRQLATLGIFTISRDGLAAHSFTSLVLKNDIGSDWSRYLVEDFFGVASNHVDALEKWGHGSRSPTKTAYNLSRSVEQQAFQHMELDPWRREWFSRTMQYLGQTNQLSVQHLVRSFNWLELGKFTLVDIGGDAGFCSYAISQAYWNATCVVQDLPQAVRRGLRFLPAQTKSVRERVTFMAHDYFKPQPLRAEVYLLRQVLHHWPDEEAITIIRNIVPNLQPTSRILVVDQVRQPLGVMRKTDERFCTAMDCMMQMMLNGKERTEHQWRDLIAQADVRLIVRAVVYPVGSLLSIIDIGVKGDVVEASM